MENTSTGELVVLVNEQDQELGTMEKLQAHQEGALHRAMSVFVFNSDKKLLLQRRAAGKYHSPGLWTNTCCSHPRPDERIRQAAIRRLQEEMGLNCVLRYAFNFVYKADVGNGLTEHEFDHVFIGVTDATPKPDPSEVSEFRYVSIDELDQEIRINPGQFTEWFRICYDNYFFQLFM